jgi:predicted metal-dependent enzyme (double-stranded beta helix superfamily)
MNLNQLLAREAGSSRPDESLHRPPSTPLSADRLGKLASSVATAESWRSVIQFTADNRWFRRLALTDDYEIWLLSWLPGQHTGFHDHGDAVGAFAVAQGRLRESLATPGRTAVRTRSVRAGSVTRFGRQHLHDVANVSPQPAVSVHAYSPPLTAMRRYEMNISGLTLVRTDVAELDW